MSSWPAAASVMAPPLLFYDLLSLLDASLPLGSVVSLMHDCTCIDFGADTITVNICNGDACGFDFHWMVCKGSPIESHLNSQ